MPTGGVSDPAGLASLDARILDRVLGAWMWTRTRVVDQRRVIATDGKTIAGARVAHRMSPHLVAAVEEVRGGVGGTGAAGGRFERWFDRAPLP